MTENQQDQIVGEAAEGRSKSTIKFPYYDLDDSYRVAHTLMNRRGGHAPVEVLAAEMSQMPSSGSFRLRMSAAGMFGLIESKGGNVDLTRLGERILQTEHEAAARVDAFLQVELYNELFNAFKTGVLPDDRGLESRIRDLGVTPNQAGKARQVFARAAKQAGFFANGNNRLVAPHTQPSNTRAGPEGEAKPSRSTVGPTVVVGGDVMADPMLAGLMRRMLPKEGEPFPAAKRELFLSALAMNLDVIYGPAEDENSVRRETPVGQSADV